MHGLGEMKQTDLSVSAISEVTACDRKTVRDYPTDIAQIARAGVRRQ